MNKRTFIALITFFLTSVALPAHAEFIINSAIIEFKAHGPMQQDIELVSRSKVEDSDYIVTEINEILNAGTKEESRNLIEDPSAGMLLVTPDKTILAGGGRKLLRFMLLKPFDAQEHIYRVAIKPVIKGVEHNSQVGIKVLVGYEVLVIVRPAQMNDSYNVVRKGYELEITNVGNTNILFQNGKQCLKKDCVLPPVVRVYPGQKEKVNLKFDQPVTYSIWNGEETFEETF